MGHFVNCFGFVSVIFSPYSSFLLFSCDVMTIFSFIFRFLFVCVSFIDFCFVATMRILFRRLYLYMLVLSCSSVDFSKQSFNFMAAVTVHSDFGAQENKTCYCFHCFPFYWPWMMTLDATILVFWMYNFKPAFSLSSFTKDWTWALAVNAQILNN